MSRSVSRRISRRWAGMALAGALSLPAGAVSAETLYYRYDALGRLVQSFSDRSAYRTDYRFDAADNRTQVSAFNINTILHVNEMIHSPDGRFSLVMQPDGNLVLYGPTGALWSTGTGGTANVADMQMDGNFVVYNSAGSPLWNSSTAGNPASYLALQSDGNLVLYDASSAPIWASNTAGH